MELLNISGRDYGGYVLAKTGLKYTLEERGSVEIITAAGGIYHRYAARKRKITVYLDMVPEDMLDVLESDMAADSFTVRYREGGRDQAGIFNLDPSGVSSSAAVIMGGVLYFTGITFILREV